MGCFPRLLACTALLATQACAADRVTAPAVPTPRAAATAAPRSEKDARKSVQYILRAHGKAKGSEPVWLVDGILMMRSDALRLVDTADIVAVRVVKAITEGAGGGAGEIVVITTKRGREP